MHKEIRVVVDNGYAVISAADPRIRSQVLGKLLATTPPQCIEKLTRSGPHALYRVPETYARRARLITKANTVDSLPDRADSGFADSHARNFEAARRGPRPAQPR